MANQSYQSGTFREGLLREIDHLHAGESLELTEATWSDYEFLLDQLDERTSLRVSYDRGGLEVVTTNALHEMYSDLLLLIASATADRLGLPFESRGSITIKDEKLRMGAEPDTCFYVGNAHRILGIGHRLLDLKIDPPPDLVVEVDISHRSHRKFLFYANIGVPELWVCDETKLRIFVLNKHGYQETETSRSFPILTARLLTDTLEVARIEGSQSAARRYLQKKLG